MELKSLSLADYYAKFSSSNCTFMELKFEKPGVRSRIEGSNCTFMELKCRFKMQTYGYDNFKLYLYGIEILLLLHKKSLCWCSNCTFMELKSTKPSFHRVIVEVFKLYLYGIEIMSGRR